MTTPDRGNKPLAQQVDIASLVVRGQQCVLWGREVPSMTRQELIAFVGFLDESLEAVRAGRLS
jgi:hypothetical protein